MPGETKHSPEPWTLQPTDRPGRVRLLAGERGPTIAIIEGAHPGDLLRLVLAVNACAGLPTEALEAGALAEALGVLEDIASGCNCDNHNDSAKDALRALGRLKP